jgi:hypothetical protein
VKDLADLVTVFFEAVPTAAGSRASRSR